MTRSRQSQKTAIESAIRHRILLHAARCVDESQRALTYGITTSHRLGSNGVQRSTSLSRLSSRADPTLKREGWPVSAIRRRRKCNVKAGTRKCNRDPHKLLQVCLSYVTVKAFPRAGTLPSNPPFQAALDRRTRSGTGSSC